MDVERNIVIVKHSWLVFLLNWFSICFLLSYSVFHSLSLSLIQSLLSCILTPHIFIVEENVFEVDRNFAHETAPPSAQREKQTRDTSRCDRERILLLFLRNKLKTFRIQLQAVKQQIVFSLARRSQAAIYSSVVYSACLFLGVFDFSLRVLSASTIHHRIFMERSMMDHNLGSWIMRAINKIPILLLNWTLNVIIQSLINTAWKLAANSYDSCVARLRILFNIKFSSSSSSAWGFAQSFCALSANWLIATIKAICLSRLKIRDKLQRFVFATLRHFDMFRRYFVCFWFFSGFAVCKYDNAATRFLLLTSSQYFYCLSERGC